MTQIGHYELQDELGAGGMGTVYLALDTQSQQTVAIKQLKSGITQSEMIERFRREGEALRDLNHPNIVKILDTFEHDGQHYLVMEYVSGGDLSKLLKQGQMPLEETLKLSIDLADALTRAHKLDIIHRDLKPANVLIGDDGVLRLTDFGVAHVGSKERVTETDAIIGTIDYLPPEAFDGRAFDARGDIWAFGVMLFEMLSGDRPFAGESIIQVIHNITVEPIPDLEALRPDVPTSLIDLIYRMLERDPQARIPSVRIIGAELEAMLEGRKITSQTPRFELDVADFADFAKHNLPIQNTPFIGRESELSELANLLEDPKIRLLTILAPGGMGKTRLALEIASHFVSETTSTNADSIFEDGVYFVELASLSHPEQIIPTIASAVHYTFPKESDDQKQQLLNFLQDKQLLLVFDNFEHLLDSAGLVTDILNSAPQIQILATSRQRLGQPNETLFHLGGMDFPDWETPDDALHYAAVKLFMNSASRAQPNFEITFDNMDYIARICRLVQGMPLGIVLSGAWLAMLSPQEIASELEQSIDLLTDELGELPERQQSIRAVMDYSWQMMSQAEQAVFMKLSVFRKGFTREAAQTIAGANLRILMSLVNKSLIRRDTDSGRYEIHELLRQYAHEQLQDSAVFVATKDKHASYYSQFLAQQLPLLKGGGQMEAVNHIEGDYDNGYATWEWVVGQKNVDVLDLMIDSLYLFFLFQYRYTEGYDIFQQAREQWSADTEDAPLIAGRVSVRFPDTSDLEAVSAIIERGLAIAEHHNNKTEIAFCLREWCQYQWQYEKASDPTLMQKTLGFAENSLALYRELGDRFYEAQLLDDIGYGYQLSGDRDKRIEYARQSIEMRKAIGDTIGLGKAINGYITRIWDTDTEGAIQLLEETYALGRRNHNPFLMIESHLALGNVIFQKIGDLERAQSLYEENLAFSNKINYDFGRRIAQLQLASAICLADGDPNQAKDLITNALANINMQTDGMYTAFGFYAFMFYNAYVGDYAQLKLTFQPYLAVFKYYGITHSHVSLLVFLAMILVGDENKEWAVQLFGLAFTHEWSTGMLTLLQNWNTVRTQLDNLRDELGEETYDRLWDEGSQLDLKTTFVKISDHFTNEA